MSLLARFRKWIFSIAPEETTVARRGFRATDPDAVERLERIGQTFAQGFHTGLEVTVAAPISDWSHPVTGFVHAALLWYH